MRGRAQLPLLSWAAQALAPSRQGRSMTAVNEVRWGRVLLGGLFIKLTMLAIILPLNSLSQQAAYYSVPVMALATAFLFGRWAARPLKAQWNVSKGANRRDDADWRQQCVVRNHEGTGWGTLHVLAR
jgi:hypothetical protein